MDAGIVRALEHQLGPLAAEERGSLFEGWVANLLRIHNDDGTLFDDWHYWAPVDAARTEVDLLLRRGRDLLAIEAKSATSVGPEELRGLRAVDEMKGNRRRVLVYRGERRLTTADGIEVWPVATLLEALAEDALWP